MGCSSSSHKEEMKAPVDSYRANADRFKSLSEVQSALRAAGLESSQLMIGIDCTKSNTWNGGKTFGGKCLHDLGRTPNPYETVIRIIGATLSPFDDDGKIPVFGFGDSSTTNKSVFSFKTNFGEGEGGGAVVDVPCNGFEEALQQYRSTISNLQLSGPTSFAPIIEKAIQTVISEGGYHILIIIADGAIDDIEATSNAIIKASNYALSIVTIGVGDGDWSTMREFDDGLPARRFDNFQFVELNSIMLNPKIENTETAFAMHALMECPDQYSFIKRSGMLRYNTSGTVCKIPGGI